MNPNYDLELTPKEIDKILKLGEAMIVCNQKNDFIIPSKWTPKTDREREFISDFKNLSFRFSTCSKVIKKDGNISKLTDSEERRRGMVKSIRKSLIDIEKLYESGKDLFDLSDLKDAIYEPSNKQIFAITI